MEDKRAKPAVLLVEDDTSIRRGLEDVFTYHGYDVVAFADGESAWSQVGKHRFDLAVLDVMLPGLDGFELCRRLRAARNDVPILLLTAKGAEEDVVTGFRAGADDYVSKPFSIRELLMRVEALLRRAGITDRLTQSLRFGPWTVEPVRRDRKTRGSGQRGSVRVLSRERVPRAWRWSRATGPRPSRRPALAR